MIQLLLLLPGLFMPIKTSCDPMTADFFLMFEVFQYKISFNESSAKEFFECIYSDNTTCSLKTMNYTNEIEVLETTSKNETVDPITLNNTFKCQLHSEFYTFNTIICDRPTPLNVFNENHTIFSCDSHNVSVTWEACAYSVKRRTNDCTHDTETHDHPSNLNKNYTGHKCQDSSTSTRSSYQETTSTAYVQENSTAVVVTQMSRVERDDRLSLIIGVTVSVGVLVIVTITALVAVCIRRKQAVEKSACSQNYTDSNRINITDNYDTAEHDGNSKLNSRRTVEPYAVIEFDEDLGFSNVSKDANLGFEQKESHNNKHIIVIPKCYESSPNSPSTESGERVDPILNSKSLFGASNEPDGLVYSKLRDKIKDATNIYDALPVLEIPGSQQLFHKPSNDAHIYFELEKEGALKEVIG